jgi:hypothetical protein
MIRELPKVDLGGTEFFVDLRLNEFRQVTNPYNSISFDEMMENEEGYVLCFDLSKKTAFHGDREELELRKGELKLLQIPHLKELDPYGYELVIERLQGQVNENARRRGL